MKFTSSEDIGYYGCRVSFCMSYLSVGVWQLCCDGDDWRGAIYAGAVWYCWTRRLRQAPSTELSADRCLSCLLFCYFSIVLWKRQGKGDWMLLLRSNDINVEAGMFAVLCSWMCQIQRNWAVSIICKHWILIMVSCSATVFTFCKWWNQDSK